MSKVNRAIRADEAKRHADLQAAFNMVSEESSKIAAERAQLQHEVRRLRLELARAQKEASARTGRFNVWVSVEGVEGQTGEVREVLDPVCVASCRVLATAELIAKRLQHEAIAAKRAILGVCQVCQCGGDLYTVGGARVCADCGEEAS